MVRDEHKRRPAVLGVTPELVLVLETHHQLNPDLLPAGIEALELRRDTALVAFASDPELTQFIKKLGEYEAGTRGVTAGGYERAASHEPLFDLIDTVRTLGPSDVHSPRVAAMLESGMNSTQAVRLDVQCWCPEDPAEASRRHEETATAVAAADGQVIAHSRRFTAGWSVLYVDIGLGRVPELAAIGHVCRIDLLPHPQLTTPQVREAITEHLPVVLPPRAGAATVAVIDSGIRSAHPLLSGSVIGVEYLGSGVPDGGDENGHGTLVASLALFGSLEEALASHEPLQSAGRLLSVRVLDAANKFPSDEVWTELLLRAMEVAVAGGARVINLSLGDPRFPYAPPRPTPPAALIDEFVRRYNVVVVISTGNFDVVEHDVDDLIHNDYLPAMLQSPNSGLLDPATAALALTVGALCVDHGQGAQGPRAPDAEKVAVGHSNWPSPLTRVGPGPMNAVKPELCAPGGSVSMNQLIRRSAADQSAVQVLGAGGRQQDRLLARDAGTSFAAPLVSHAALTVWGRYPGLSGNAVRVLLLASVVPVENVLNDPTTALGRAAHRKLTGYGGVSAERVAASFDHRAVLLAESSIALDGVHVYRVPVPKVFFATGRPSVVALALAYDPPVRQTRLDYLASRMEAIVYHGPSAETVASAYAADLATADAPPGDSALGPTSISESRINLDPSTADRSRGAHQYGSISRQQRWDQSKSDEFVIAVRNINKWDAEDAKQTYALALTLERPGEPSLYADLRAQLEALVEVEVELEAEG